ncbi:hypothetical protein HAX54_006228 [Datura stramonium]|uniref:Uncharacterized protein n=1 Tax=Datura stramonium TaxID=4076 RepID=A0ABS8RUG5_DATST|nr:hypothetical protein [Datura stramonium]
MKMRGWHCTTTEATWAHQPWRKEDRTSPRLGYRGDCNLNMTSSKRSTHDPFVELGSGYEEPLHDDVAMEDEMAKVDSRPRVY